MLLSCRCGNVVRVLWVIAGLLFFLQVYAAEEVTAETSPQPVSGKWTAEADLGFNMSRGNTRTESLNAKLDVHHTYTDWLYEYQFEAKQASNNGETTAEQYTINTRSQYALNKFAYLYGMLRYEDDRFAGFDRRTTEVMGYGRKVYNTDKFKLDTEVGAGTRQADKTDGTTSDEVIARLAFNMIWAISKTSQFKQELAIEDGAQNTFTESLSELKVKINGDLSLKLSMQVKDNSNPPKGNKHTDTYTAVTLSYDIK